MIYYMWQDNLRGEQGTKCPLCPSLPSGDSVGTGRAWGGCWVLGARVWRWVAGMPSKAAGLGKFCAPGEALWLLSVSWRVLEEQGSLGW